MRAGIDDPFDDSEKIESRTGQPVDARYRDFVAALQMFERVGWASAHHLPPQPGNTPCSAPPKK
jgi:hypothetical protein